MHRLLPLLGLLLLSACATPVQMQPSRAAERFDLDGRHLLLMRLQLRNAHTPQFPLRPYFMAVETPDADEKSEKLNVVVDSDAIVTTSEAGDFLLRLPVANGDYLIQGLIGRSHLTLLPGDFFMPLRSPLHLEGEPQLVYVGRVEGVMRAREEGEFRAATWLQPVAQALLGYAEATFEVTVSDHYDEDVALFRATFPALDTQAIVRGVLPPFDRAVAQRMWELNQ